MSRTALGFLFVVVAAVATFESSFMMEPMQVDGTLNEINAMLLYNKDSRQKVSMLAELSNQPDLGEEGRRFLMNFLALEELAKQGETNPATCNRRGHEILRTNYDSLATLDGPTEMDRVLNDYAIEHAKVCLLQYVKKFAPIFNPAFTKYRSLRSFFDRITNSRKTDERLSEEELAGSAYRWNLRIREISGEHDARLAHKTLVEFATTNRHPYLRYLFGFIDERKVVHEKLAFKIYEEYLIKPCEDYIEEFGPDIFGPADFDYMTLQGPECSLVTLDTAFIRHGHYGFLQHWRDYRLCHALLRNRDEHSGDRFFDDILSVISKTTV